jgi:hypothetical protein
MLWTCSRDGHSGTLQGHWHWVDCRRTTFVRFWVADRSDSWSVLAFGAKWIISGWRPIQCGRPACITTAYLWHNLHLVHSLEDYHGTPIITEQTCLCIDTWHTHTSYGTLYMGTDGRWNGANSPIGSWQHGYEGGVEREAMASRPTLTTGSAHCIGKPRARGGHRAD